MIGRLFLFCLTLFLLPSPALAWWEYGHETVARIAFAEVRPETRAEIRRLLAQSARLETPTCPARSIAQASVWPDCIKRLGDRFSFASPWHYQNIDICRPFDPAADCRDGNCVTAQIPRQMRLLADRTLPVRERVTALAFLVHLVGDLHQPLHVGEHRDEGGNRQPASYGIIAGRTNLHTIWDGYLAERAISTPPPDASGIMAGFSAAEQAQMREGAVGDWARESWQAARDYAYGAVISDPCGPAPAARPVVTEAIAQRLIPIVRRQVARGGIRLARLLDEALSVPPRGAAVGRNSL